jgi:hypothetical protein
MDAHTAEVMFGTTPATIDMIKASHEARAESDQLMELMSRLSDVQEMIVRGNDEEARVSINIVKMLLNERWQEAKRHEIDEYEHQDRLDTDR